MNTPAIILRGRIERLSTPEPNTGCWLWLGTANPNGYGCMSVDCRVRKAHRVSYSVFVGTIPAGMHVLHRCDVRACVNPAHLYLGTHQDNMRDMNHRGRHFRPAGAIHPRAKLTWSQVSRIRSRYGRGGVLQRDLAAEYGVGRDEISRIVTGVRWTPPTEARPPKKGF